MAEVRRLNELGIEAFSEFLYRVKNDSSLGPPNELLTHSSTSESLGEFEIDVDPVTFGSRLAAAAYLSERVSGCGLKNIEKDRGLWAWLSLFYFEELCPPDKKGNRAPGEIARWIPVNTHAFRYYRHLLAGPYRIYLAHRDNPDCAKILLCGPLHQPGDIVEQLASRQELVTNGALLGAASSLYFDPVSGRPKRGAASKDKDGKKPGTVRRLVDVCRHFDVTWDLYSMDAKAVLALLPTEFDKFRSN